MRTYNYNQDDFQGLFVKVVERLSVPGNTADLVKNTLVEICSHFKFGCGTIYEIDHTGVLHLKERFSTYIDKEFNETIDLPAIDPNGALGNCLKTQLYINIDSNGVPELDCTLAKLFRANCLVFVPIIDDEENLIGLIGMMDRRHNILLQENDIHVAETVLNVLANYVKLRLYQRKIEFARNSLISTLDNMGIDIYVNDFYTHEILYANKSMAKPCGGLDQLIGRKCWQALYDDKTEPCNFCPQKELASLPDDSTKVYSWDYQRPFDGSWFRVFSATFNWVDGRLAHVVSSVDITENKKNEDTITKMATMDALTNLPNRRKLALDFQKAVANCEDEIFNAYVVFFDLDNFKAINDTMGHQIGDELLQAVAAELADDPLANNSIYRFGGDEFVLFYENVNYRQILKTIRFLLERFSKPWLVNDQEIICRTSIGVAKCPTDGETLKELIDNADRMMYTAKKMGKGIACFSNGEVIKPRSGHTRRVSSATER